MDCFNAVMLSDKKQDQWNRMRREQLKDQRGLVNNFVDGLGAGIKPDKKYEEAGITLREDEGTKDAWVEPDGLVGIPGLGLDIYTEYGVDVWHEYELGYQTLWIKGGPYHIIHETFNEHPATLAGLRVELVKDIYRARRFGSAKDDLLSDAGADAPNEKVDGIVLADSESAACWVASDVGPIRGGDDPGQQITSVSTLIETIKAEYGVDVQYSAVKAFPSHWLQIAGGREHCIPSGLERHAATLTDVRDKIVEDIERLWELKKVEDARVREFDRPANCCMKNLDVREPFTISSSADWEAVNYRKAQPTNLNELSRMVFFGHGVKLHHEITERGVHLLSVKGGREFIILQAQERDPEVLLTAYKCLVGMLEV